MESLPFCFYAPDNDNEVILFDREGLRVARTAAKGTSISCAQP